jgi:parallel beta-helix repeat protein
MRRLLIALAMLLTIVSVGELSSNPEVHAQAADFRIVSINCSSQPGHVGIQNTTAGIATLDQLALLVTSANVTIGQFVIQSAIVPTTANSVNTGVTIDLQLGTGATQSPPTATPPFAPASVALTTNNLLTTGVNVQLVDASTTPPTLIGTPASCPAPGVQPFIVSPNGVDFLDAAQTIPNSVCGPDLPPGTTPSSQNPGPCLTVANALKWANDGDTIFVEDGIYEVCQPIEVNKLVHITSRQAVGVSGTAGTPAPPLIFGATPNPAQQFSTRVIFHSFTGDSVFHVTAIGYPDASSPGYLPPNAQNNLAPFTRFWNGNYAMIDYLRIGGAFKPGAAAISLDGDAYTDVSNDWIGGEPINNRNFTGIPCSRQPPFPPSAGGLPGVVKQEVFGNANGIILANSDHPNIFNDTIIGSVDPPFSPTLAVGAVLSGFGIVSTECLGQGADASNGVVVNFTTISRNANAGIWLCSDGGGGHLIGSNAIRNNGRGIILRAVTTTLLDTNTISDSAADGIVIYDASSNNVIQKNVIEGQRTPGSAGIRVGGFGASLFPLQTGINNNTLRRNWVNIDIIGARNTIGLADLISAEDERTGILIEVGSTGSPDITQPVGTDFQLSQIIFNGGCSATQGCAVRLNSFVTTDAAMNRNNFGLPPHTDVNSVLWHKPNDPTLGFISADQPNYVPVQVSATPGVGAPGANGPNFDPQRPFDGIGYVTPVPTATAQPFPPNSGAGPTATAVGNGVPAGFPATATATPIPGTPVPQPTGLITPPVLRSGPPGGSTTYAPPCNFITVPTSVGASITTGRFLEQFQPVANIFSAWRYDNATHMYASLYFSDPTIPVDVALLRPGNIVSLCLTDSVQGPP